MPKNLRNILGSSLNSGHAKLHICFLVNNDIFYYEQMVDLTTLLLKYSCSNSKNGFSIIIYSQIEICSISMWLEMVLLAKDIYVHGKKYAT